MYELKSNNMNFKQSFDKLNSHVIERKTKEKQGLNDVKKKFKAEVQSWRKELGERGKRKLNLKQNSTSLLLNVNLKTIMKNQSNSSKQALRKKRIWS